MRKYTFFFFLFFSFISALYAENITLSPNTPIQGSGVYDFWENNIFVEKIIFPFSDDTADSKRVYINAQELDSLNKAQIKWNFWLQSLSVSSDPALWWVSFDHWVSWSETYLTQIGTSQQYLLNWFAWSKAVGWIYFWDRLGANKPIYNRDTGEITGYGWSENIGWIPMLWLRLITTAPEINIPTVFEANNSKNIVIISPAITINSKIENHNNPTFSLYNTKNFTHNFQTVKPWNYEYEISDGFGNKLSWDFRVVANRPQIVTPIVTSWDKIADGVEKHKIKIELKDTYGNPVISVPWIKQVEVEIKLHNDVCMDQIDTPVCLWDAISYSDSIWFGYLHYTNNSATGSNSTDGKYELSMSSFAPTEKGYSYALGNINIDTLDYKIIPLNGYTWVGELSLGSKVDIYWGSMAQGEKLSFTPAVYVDNIIPNSTRIMRDVSVIFDADIKKSTLESISNFKIHHILDVGNNLMMSFQSIQKNGTEILLCTGNNTQTGYVWNDECDLSIPSASSNILLLKTGPLSQYTSSFQATPKIVALADPNFSSDYSSKIEYKISGKTIRFLSLNKSFSDLISNQEVKIAWIANSWGYEVSNISTNKILSTSITKADLRMQIAKNVEMYTKNGIPSHIEFKNTNYTLNTWPWTKDTIIVKWADLIINGNITKTDINKLNSIVVLRENGVWGNIWINKNVRFISAILYMDGHLLSWDGISYYSDVIPSQAKDQLVIKGSIVSNNTIWGSSQSPYICPYRFNDSTSCSEQESRRYDLNHFRHFISESILWKGDGVGEKFTPWTWPWEIDVTYDVIDMGHQGYKDSPMIIEYDNKVQLNPPKIFLNN